MHVLYGISAAVIAMAAVVLARQMTDRWLGPLAVFVLFASWALCIWLTPLGPHLWRASAIGFLVVGALVVGWLLVVRDVPLAGAPEQAIAAARRGAILRRSAMLLLLMFALPVIAHLATYGRLPVQR